MFVQACGAFFGFKHLFQGFQGPAEFFSKLLEALLPVGGDAGQLTKVGPKNRPALFGNKVAGRVGVPT